MELTAEQAAKAKVLFEYEEAKKALAQRRDDIHTWGKALIAAGEALLNHPGTMILDGVPNTDMIHRLHRPSQNEPAPATASSHNRHTEEPVPHCNPYYLSADQLAKLLIEFRDYSQPAIELEQQKKRMGYF